MPAPPPFSAATSLAELLERCRRYEPAAQWALYQRFAGPMLLLAQRYAASAADAEDALQDAFVKIFQQLHEQRVEGAFAGWVRRIVITTALNAGRSRRVRRIDFDLDDAHHVPSADASAIDQLTLAEVQVLIDRLPDGCRVVLLLYTIEGYSHAEIAEMLGIGESASKAQLTRARQRLTVLVQQAGRERTIRPGTAPPGTLVARPDAAAPPFLPIKVLLFQ